MVRRIIFALLALCYTTGTLAQSFPKPPDVPAYVAVTPLYKTDGTANTPIDPAVTPPPYTELTNIPVPSTTGRVSSGHTYGPGSPYCLIIADGGTCNETKFRTSIDCGYILPDDPIRNYGQPGQSHLHQFCGAGSANANSTYKTLRQHALDSAAAGIDINATAYWRPCTVVLNPYGDGKNFCLKDNFWTVYYVGLRSMKPTHYPVGLRFVTGFDMDAASPSTQFAWLQTIIDAANVASGYNRYSLKNSSGQYENQGFYNCSGATPSAVPYYVNPDGSDPFNGTCASGALFWISVDGARCWDGHNPWSPGGYKHLIPGVYDSTVSKFVCPYNYYATPALRLEILETQYGWTDRQRWCLSSDISYRAAHSLTATQVPCGMTFHMDWDYGWDSTIFLQALRNCAGVDGVAGRECNSSVYASCCSLIGGNSGENGLSRFPQVDFATLSHVNETDPGWMLIAPAWSGALTNMHMHN
jgi:hypothetical protein